VPEKIILSGVRFPQRWRILAVALAEQSPVLAESVDARGVGAASLWRLEVS
jgi:hypothetical protein